MFSRMQLLASPADLTRRFGVDVNPRCDFRPSEVITAFDHNPHPVIIDTNPQTWDCRYRWGLVPPNWRRAPEEIWDRTPTAKLEYLEKRYSWKQVSRNRCLIPVTAYFEFRWNDASGKSKARFTIRHGSSEIFALAGLHSHWTDGKSELFTFAVCTTSANEIMQFVQNKDAARNYHRMPVMLNPADELSWLDSSISHSEFAYPRYKPDLIATPDAGIQETLF